MVTQLPRWTETAAGTTHQPMTPGSPLDGQICVVLVLKPTIHPQTFPECVEGFPFHSGGLGVEGVIARRRCATVRNRPREGRKFCKRVYFLEV